MKRAIALLSVLLMISTFAFIPAAATSNPPGVGHKSVDTTTISTNGAGVSVSPVMTYSEMIQQYADDMGISYGQAQLYFPKATNSTRSAEVGYRTLSVTLNVTDTYKPHISFYCETTEYGHYWAITSIYSMQLVRSYNGISKQFGGDMGCWLRSGYQIEFYINGDFFNNGTTTVGSSGGFQFGIDELCSVTCTVSNSTSSNHYAYFYDHRTVAFQS